ncbi:MAG: FG-GAP repeat protein [Ignavibacteria bacterium]|nr:FG-GAP repeat protein [Ignavibacteria bacterium]
MTDSSDVIAGAMMNDGIATNAGRAYVYFGGVALNSVADVVLNGVSANDFFGHSVSTAGDVNGDGYSDVIAGAPFNDAAGNESGRAYLFLGGALMNNTADITITGAAAGDNLGHSVSTAGDINGDGYSDILTGAYGNDETGSSAGRAYVHMGGMDPDNITDAIFSGAAANDNFGISVSSAGDFNGDGFSDIILGAVNNDAGGSDAGRAYLYLNSLTGTDIEDEIYTGATLDYLGYSVSSVGDVNGDGYDDMIIAAIGNNSDRGIAYIHYGGTVPDNTPDLILTGIAAGDQFGWSVSGAGDVNGDGYDDVIVGAPYNDAGGSNAGRGILVLRRSCYEQCCGCCVYRAPLPMTDSEAQYQMQAM